MKENGHLSNSGSFVLGFDQKTNLLSVQCDEELSDDTTAEVYSLRTQQPWG